MLLQQGISTARAGCIFRNSKNAGPLSRSLHRSWTWECCSSPPGTSCGGMSVNTPPWMPVFAAVGDDNVSSVKPKCLIRIVSYNILAQVYVKSEKFATSPRSSLRWKNRSQAVVSRLLSLDADLLCLQELDEFHSFYKEALHRRGYGSVYIQRGNERRDGCGIFYRHSKVSLLAEEAIDYNDLVPPKSPGESEGETGEDSSGKAAQKRGDMRDVRVRLKRDCVGIIASFRPVEAPTRILIVSSNHIFWDPVFMDVKLAQVQYLAERLLAFQKRTIEEYEVEPLLLVAGDFNSLPGDTVYNYVTSKFDQHVKVKALGYLVDEQRATSGHGQADREWCIRFTGRFPLPLVSLYAYVDKEPPATNYTCKFVGTLDYIFFIPSKQLKPKTLLALRPRDAPDVAAGLPNNFHPSDHLPIGSDFGIY